MSTDLLGAHLLQHLRQLTRERRAQRYDAIAEEADSNPVAAAIAVNHAYELRRADSVNSRVPDHINRAVEEELEAGLVETINDPNGDPGLVSSARQALLQLRAEQRRR